MTEQDKQALIKHFCERDCGEAAKGCTIMPCHEIELIQEFPTSEADSDTISRAKAIDAVKRLSLGETDAMRLAMRIGDYLERLSPAQPERIKGRWVPADTLCGIKCSNCGYPVDDFCYSIDYIDLEYAPNFCPNCGAEMEVTT